MNDDLVDPSGLGVRMKIKCIVFGFEEEVDNGIYQKDIEVFHLRILEKYKIATIFIEYTYKKQCCRIIMRHYYRNFI